MKVLDTWEKKKSYFMAMELCDGGDLFSYVSNEQRNGQTSIAISKSMKTRQQMTCPSLSTWNKMVQKWFRELVDCVSFLHKNGVTHGDLSLENTMLTKNKENGGLSTKIIDFGLSTLHKRGENNFNLY